MVRFEEALETFSPSPLLAGWRRRARRAETAAAQNRAPSSGVAVAIKTSVAPSAPPGDAQAFLWRQEARQVLLAKARKARRNRRRLKGRTGGMLRVSSPARLALAAASLAGGSLSAAAPRPPL